MKLSEKQKEMFRAIRAARDEFLGERTKELDAFIAWFKELADIEKFDVFDKLAGLMDSK